MKTTRKNVEITGANGYLGAIIRGAFIDAGWHSISLVRSPVEGDDDERFYDLAAPCDERLVADMQLLIHCAYDLSLTEREKIKRVNVDGTRRLLIAARDAGVPRVNCPSSMSAFDGTTQTYGQAKLAIERAAMQTGNCVLRPGLVYGGHAGGILLRSYAS